MPPPKQQQPPAGAVAINEGFSDADQEYLRDNGSIPTHLTQPQRIRSHGQSSVGLPVGYFIIKIIPSATKNGILGPLLEEKWVAKRVSNRTVQPTYGKMTNFALNKWKNDQNSILRLLPYNSAWLLTRVMLDVIIGNLVKNLKNDTGMSSYNHENIVFWLFCHWSIPDFKWSIMTCSTFCVR